MSPMNRLIVLVACMLSTAHGHAEPPGPVLAGANEEGDLAQYLLDTAPLTANVLANDPEFFFGKSAIAHLRHHRGCDLRGYDCRATARSITAPSSLWLVIPGALLVGVGAYFRQRHRRHRNVTPPLVARS